MRNPKIPDRPPPRQPAGEGRSAWRATLEAGAALLQDMTPLKDFDIYVAGLHCGHHEPEMQMEAHHFCRQVNQDLLQCVIFDGNTKDANLIGIEYIISERLFGSLKQDFGTALGVDEPQRREKRSGLVAKAHPQQGVDAMADEFEGTTALPGVVEG